MNLIYPFDLLDGFILPYHLAWEADFQCGRGFAGEIGWIFEALETSVSPK